MKLFNKIYIKDENISYLHFQLPQDLWPPHLADWWVNQRDHNQQSYVTLRSRGDMKSRYKHISTSPKAVTAKVGKVGIYNKGPPSIKSFDVLSTWSSDHITWLIKNVIFLLPRELWLRNLTEWWVLMRAYHPQSNITGWSCCHIKSYNKWKTS